MIERLCKLPECGTVFTVAFRSNPKAFCGSRCAGLAIQRARPAGAAAADAVRGAAKAQGRVTRFIAGKDPVEIFRSAVVLGYRRRVLEGAGQELGEVGKLTRAALAG